MTSEAITLPECRRCGMQNARGVRTIHEDSTVEFRCDTCGRRMRLGNTIEGQNAQTEQKRNRERAEQNRSRYRREKFDQVMERHTQSPIGIDDADNAITEILDPSFREDDDDTDSGVPFMV